MGVCGLGNKKGPVRSLVVAHGRISPDGYTVLPIRVLTTTRMFCVMVRSVTAANCAVKPSTLIIQCGGSVTV